MLRESTKCAIFSPRLKIFTRQLRTACSLIPFFAFLLTISLTTPIKAQISESIDSANYCVAVRGNGELAPAHWGAFAQALESFGVPVAAAGGSSASITVFLFESMLANPIIAALPAREKRQTLALLFKALEPLISKIAKDSKFEEARLSLQKIQTEFSNLPSNGLLTVFALIQSLGIINSTLSTLENALRSLQESQILNGPAVQRLGQDFALLQQQFSFPQLKLVLAELNDIKQSLAVFGKFSAKDDRQLFIRDGLVNFEALAQSFGALGDFLSLRNATGATAQAFQNFTTTCGAQTVGVNWETIVASHTECKPLLVQWIDSYFPTYSPQPNSRLNEPIGQTISVIASTAIIQGESVAKFKSIKAEYQRTFSPGLGSEMSVVNNEDLKFGYWGRPADLAKMQASLDPEIDKNSRFLSLGNATWKKILAFSPAEPGLSPFLEYDEMISMGGWSDLHPIPALKAIGCKNVVYLTRNQGDSIFAMGVAKRLLNIPELTWDYLEKDPAMQADFQKTNLKNAIGSDDTISAWGRLFNIRNPKSSFAYSLNLAEAVICTNWNYFDIKTDFHAMIEDAYRAPIYNRANLPTQELVSPRRFLKSSDIQDKTSEGIPLFAGCIPY
jgi:hypothetical protein